MGQISSLYDEIKKIREVVQKDGPEGVSKHIDCLNLSKPNLVEIAITGRVETGKSTFINAIRKIKRGEPNYASPSKVPVRYVYPKNENLILWDIPSTDGITSSPEKYTSEEAINHYDFFLIFFAPTLIREDVLLAEKVFKLKKPFCLIRSKMDQAVLNGKRNEERPEKVIEDIQLKTQKAIKTWKKELEPSKTHVYLISSVETEKYDLPKLIGYIEEKVSVMKFETVLDGICSKLRSRLAKTTAVCAFVSGLPIPVTDVFFNIDVLLGEIKYYMAVLNMSDDDIQKLIESVQHSLRYRQQSTVGFDLLTLIFGNVGKTVLYGQVLSNRMDLFPVVVESAVSAFITAAVVYNRLNTTLEDLRHDAILIYKQLSKQKRDRISTSSYSFP